MKKLFLSVIVILALLCNNNMVLASSGRLRSNSIKNVNGVLYGQHGGDNHWHVAIKNSNGTYNASGDPIYSDPSKSSQSTSSSSSSKNNGGNANNNSSTNGKSSTNSDNNSRNVSTSPVEKLSNDTSLLSLKIDEQEITLVDAMTYETYNQKITVEAIARDSKSTVSVDDTKNLTIGENKIIIKVTAEDKSVKNYELTVIRKKVLSNNKNVKVIINDKEVTFNNYESDRIYISNSIQNLDIQCVVEDANAKVEIINNKELKEGENKITVTVIAEDETKQDYIVNIYRYEENEETISGIIGLVLLVVIGVGIYFIIKKIKKYFIKKSKKEDI